MIDSSSAETVLAVLAAGRPLAESRLRSQRDGELAEAVRRLSSPQDLTAVAVSLGPGSFTGLRLGASYAVGLALGRTLPLLGFGSLELQLARARRKAMAVVEAGRGRLYWLRAGPGEVAGLGNPADLPAGWPLVGWLRPSTQQAVTETGLTQLPEAELRTFGEGAARVLEGAQELTYDTVRLRYMQSLGSGRT
ncbi:MAG: tRNA (adenosine(37)-N6)-threonylcarbamoyltransferase complex dimerization subunit type 1 TsaB [Candidatus Dormibacteraeota bacterium]|nr:tRNA (adenosine(37)-N6)-threonylcarbamoyltransferase complex dimerization subunit type 1 TsaB [Candidatus Dormibacteraeota bacterium]